MPHALRVIRRALFALALVPPALAAQATAAAPPDIVLLGGKVFTVDSARPWAEAVAIRGNRIVGVGTTAEIGALAGPRTRRVDVGGRTVVPGINDAHVHIGPPRRGTFFRADPAPTPDPEPGALLDSIRAVARRAPLGSWIFASVGERALSSARLRRASLDSVAPRHPVWLGGWSGHGALLNSSALRAARLDRGSDPVGGWLERDERGRPTGRVDEYALYTASRRLAIDAGRDALVNAARDDGREAAGFGITTLQSFATGMDLDGAKAIASSRGFPVRLRIVRFPVTDEKRRLTDEWRTGADLAGLAYLSGTKWILDGTPVERLAFVRAPYADQPGWHGRMNFPPDTLRAILRESLASGDQPMFHAVGDSTIALLLASMRELAPDSAWRRLRVRIEHGDQLDADQFDAVRSLGIVVVQNPSHLTIPNMLSARWGAERLARSSRLRSILEAGIPLALGSDGPINPWLNVLFASTNGANPSEALTREQAVAAYTRGAAYAEGAEAQKGTIAPGMLADVTVLSADIFTAPPPEVPGIRSVLTIVDGRVVVDELRAGGRR